MTKRTSAVAVIKGSDKYPAIKGKVWFDSVCGGIMVTAEISGLPVYKGDCEIPIFAFHIHSGATCTGNESDPFADVNGHYNPNDCPHPFHAGDLPPLFSANGVAKSRFLTDRFTIPQIIGKTIIIHGMLDDFTTQPSGNAGEKIACGEIR